jgi:hypothetical protein
MRTIRWMQMIVLIGTSALVIAACTPADQVKAGTLVLGSFFAALLRWLLPLIIPAGAF